MPVQMDTPSRLLRELLEQNRFTCQYAFGKVHADNHHLKLNPQTASLGFMFRHTGEIMHLLATFLGQPTEVQNTTMGFSDTGQGTDVEASRLLVESGYAQLIHLIDQKPAPWWEEAVETPFFGTLPRVRLFGHILNHNAYHAGQMSLALKRPGVSDLETT